MGKYRFNVVETYSAMVEIEAESADDAFNSLKEKYEDDTDKLFESAVSRYEFSDVEFFQVR